ncbi:MAG: flavodoxin domain-containing protein [Gaiellaceae bacterium]
MIEGRVLVAYATKHGSTREVAESVASTLRGRGIDVEVKPAVAVNELDPYSAVVLGGALYTGRWHADARRLLAKRRKELAALPVAVFAMGPKTLDAAAIESSRKQLQQALAKVPEVKPLSIAIFGGVLDPKQHRFPFNRMEAMDARDWNAIREWADGLPGRFSKARQARS